MLAGGTDNEGDGAKSRNSCRAVSVESRVESDHSARYGVEEGIPAQNQSLWFHMLQLRQQPQRPNQRMLWEHRSVSTYGANNNRIIGPPTPT